MIKVKPAPRRHDDGDDDAGGGDTEQLRQRLLQLIESADDALLQKLAAAISGDDFDDDGDGDGLAAGATDNLPSGSGAGFRERRRKAQVGKFSESQRGDLERVQRYVAQHEQELRRGGADPQEMVGVFARALQDGYRLQDLLPRGA